MISPGKSVDETGIICYNTFGLMGLAAGAAKLQEFLQENLRRIPRFCEFELRLGK